MRYMTNVDNVAEEFGVWVYSLQNNTLVRKQGTVLRRMKIRRDGTAVYNGRANLKIEGRAHYINCSSDEWDIYGSNLWCIELDDARAVDVFIQYELKKVDELNRMLATHELRIKGLLERKKGTEHL